MGNLELEHHDRDNDRDHSVTEGFKTGFCQGVTAPVRDRTTSRFLPLDCDDVTNFILNTETSGPD